MKYVQSTTKDIDTFRDELREFKSLEGMTAYKNCLILNRIFAQQHKDRKMLKYTKHHLRSLYKKLGFNDVQIREDVRQVARELFKQGTDADIEPSAMQTDTAGSQADATAASV